MVLDNGGIIIHYGIALVLTRIPIDIHKFIYPQNIVGTKDEHKK